VCLAVRLPRCRLHQHLDQRFPAHRSLFLLSHTAPFARTGLSLPGNACPFRNLHSRIDVPDLILRSCAGCLPRPFGLPARPPLPVRPGRGRLRSFWPVASPTARALDLLDNLHSPFGNFLPSGSKRSVAYASLSARLAILPDLLSLPAAVCLFQALTATDHRSWSATSSLACCSSNLLEPSPL